MDRIRTRPTLMARIMEAQKRAAYADREPRATRHRDVSFAERYRGTEYETRSPVLVTHEPPVSRGRSFVIVLGAAALSMTGALLAASPS